MLHTNTQGVNGLGGGGGEREREREREMRPTASLLSTCQNACV